MCLVVFSYKQHAAYDLVFAANRDEFYERPTRPAQFWDEYPGLLAGKDLKAGGTWMGITGEGAFSALTNYRDPAARKDNPPSRGHLVLDYLAGEEAPRGYLEKAHRKADRYNGFNLLAGNPEELLYYSNRQKKIIPLDPGLYGLSNHLLDTSWPKVDRAKSKVADLLENNTFSEEALFNMLKDDWTAPDQKLPDTGIPKELERAVSPVFIKTGNYGTRSSTVLLIDKQGAVTFEERRYKSGTQTVDEINRYEFEIDR